MARKQSAPASQYELCNDSRPQSQSQSTLPQRHSASNRRLVQSPAKRKAPESPVQQRPPKSQRAMSAKPSVDEAMVDIDVVSDDSISYDGHDHDAAPETDMVVAGAGLPIQESPDWQNVIGKVVKKVVSVRFCQPCSFETDPAMSSEASGFIVDAERGLILTNRHVVGPGPFCGHCVFDNHEEVDVYALYRDPVHDFGFLRFDPKAIKYMKVDALDMRPDLAKIGTEIRVVGNDAGEKLSILSGVISRLDRNTPEYGEGYNDFNTCYYQASCSATGGSSGSPVVTKEGYAIAMMAGGRWDGATTDYFFPLDRAYRALKCIQEGKPVSRGDIQCQFLLKPFDECRRLGLPSHWEAQVRETFPDITNMLVAEIVLPEGPSHNKLEEGDVLLKINDELISQFIRFDEILDSAVGGNIKVLVNRGGDDIEVEVDVGDLHAITPSRFVAVGGATFQDLSYQQARIFAVPIKGVYLCHKGGSWQIDCVSGVLIQSVDQKKTPDLDTFIQVMKAIPDKARVVATFRYLRDMHTPHTIIIQVDRHWFPKMRMAVRNDATGLWDFSEISDALPALPPVPRSAAFTEVENAPHPAIADLARSFVQVDCSIPIRLDGFPMHRRWGVGLVIDAEKGLVIISRAIVPYDLCDITVTVADSIMIEAKVVFLHPLQNYAVIKYDPSLVRAPVLSARLSDTPLSKGAAINFVGVNRQGRMVHTATTVVDIHSLTIPATSSTPRYRALNLDAIRIDTALSLSIGSGVLVGADGLIQALWLTYLGERSPATHLDEEYYLGLAVHSIRSVVDDLRNNIVPKLRFLSVEFRAIPMSQARVMGVPEEWIQRVTEANKTLHQLFMVSKRAYERGDQHSGLEEGDIVLTFNGSIVSKISDLDVMYHEEVLDAVVVRDSQVVEVKANTVAADDVETDYAVLFCGALLHRPHHAVRQQINKLHSEVYISITAPGSPSEQYQLAPTNFITHVNSKPTPDIPSFIEAVRDIPDNTYFHLRAVTFDSLPWVVTLKKNDHYFPMGEFIKDPREDCGWRRITYEAGKAVQGEPTDGVVTIGDGEQRSDETVEGL